MRRHNPHVFEPTTAHVFESFFRKAREDSDQIADATSPFEHVDGTRYYLSTWAWKTRGVAGYAIRPDGDLVFVFATRPGSGAEIVAHAVASGAETLDCFDGYLPTLYARHGFVEYAREANWTPGGPDVVFMATPARLERFAS